MLNTCIFDIWYRKYMYKYYSKLEFWSSNLIPYDAIFFEWFKTPGAVFKFGALLESPAKRLRWEDHPWQWDRRHTKEKKTGAAGAEQTKLKPAMYLFEDMSHETVVFSNCAETPMDKQWKFGKTLALRALQLGPAAKPTPVQRRRGLRVVHAAILGLEDLEADFVHAASCVGSRCYCIWAHSIFDASNQGISA